MPTKSYPSFAAYLRDQKPKNQTIIRALRKFVAAREPALTEAVKWGNGCWIGKKSPVAYVYSDKTFVQFGFFHGVSLKDPHKLLEGAGAYVRHVKVRAVSDIDERKFGALLKQGVRLEKRLPRPGAKK